MLFENVALRGRGKSETVKGLKTIVAHGDEERAPHNARLLNYISISTLLNLAKL